MTFDREYFNLGYLDSLSYKETVIHRLDPRIKLIATFAFIITVVSFSKYEISGLAPFFLYPVVLFSLGNIPAEFILKKILIVSPFALFIGIFNPLFDTDVRYMLFGLSISGGWISFLSIMIKFVLTVSSALLLVATTSFPGVCSALLNLRVPSIFVSQLLFLYRYIFVLIEEAMRIVRARDVRSFRKKGQEFSIYINLIGVLFVRTIERSDSIYRAMLARGFSGEIRTLRKYRITVADLLFLFVTIAGCSLFRTTNITVVLGDFMKGQF